MYIKKYFMLYNVCVLFIGFVNNIQDVPGGMCHT
jgi:hypothetical protein